MNPFFATPGRLIICLLLSGCLPSVPDYQGSSASKNLSLTAMTKGGTLSYVGGRFLIYLSNDGCHFDLAGKVPFSQSGVAIFVPSGRAMIVIAEFKESGIGQSSMIEASQYFRVRAGMKYHAYAEYKNRGYKLIVTEARTLGNVRGREVGKPIQERPPCRKPRK